MKGKVTITGNATGQAMVATTTFRWLQVDEPRPGSIPLPGEPGPGQPRPHQVLQQAWQGMNTGSIEWSDVEIVNEESTQEE